MTSYNGAFKHQLPLIIQLYQEGKTPAEIEKIIKPVAWYGGVVQYLSPALLKYILRREGIIAMPIKKPMNEHNQSVVADFNQRWNKWENQQSWFEDYAKQLYIELEGIIRALERRKKAHEVDIHRF